MQLKEIQHSDHSACGNDLPAFQHLLSARTPWGAQSELKWHNECLGKVKQFSITQSNGIQLIRIQFIESVPLKYTVDTLWVFM